VTGLLWGEETAGRRGPKRSLTVDTIADTATRLADAEGLSAVSMSRIAAELGVTSMALYRYVSGKDDVLALMADRVLPSVAVLGEPADGWRPSLERWMAAQLDVIERRQWILGLPLTTVPRGPRALEWIDWAMGSLEDTPLDPGERLAVVGLLASFLLAEGRLRVEHAQAAERTASSGEDGTPAAAALDPSDIVGTIRAHLDDSRFPHLAAAFGSVSADQIVEADTVYDDVFGMHTILDGVAALIARRTG
jgi:AcrR family transcriptional regulator